MKLERRLLNLEREAESLMGSFELSDGSVYRYGPEAVRGPSPTFSSA